MMTIRTLLERAAAGRPRRAALRFRRDGVWRSRTYAELACGVGEIAEAFGRLGLKPGAERLALMLENGPEWVETYLAAAGAGVAVVPLDPKFKAEEADFILRDSGAVVAVVEPRHLGWLEASAQGLPELRAVVVAGGGAGWRAPERVGGRPCFAYEALRAGVAAGAAAWYAAHRPAPQEVASVIYTSGTTGVPKGAVLTHNNFCSDVAGALEAIGERVVGPADDFLVVLPLFHSFSFTANFLLALYCGGGLQFVESVRTLAEDMRVLRPTVLMAVPLLAEKLLARLDARVAASRLARALLALRLGACVGRSVRKAFGGRLRFLVVGGAPCPLHVLHGFRRLGLTLIEGYGLTECAPVVSINSLRRPRPGSIGRKLPNIEVRIAAPDAAGVGELQVRGPIVMKGYLRNAQATSEAFDGDWFRTGDLASRDDEGYLTIRGRSKALIVNREGKNIYPEEVEQVIARDPLVADVVVVGYHVGGDPGERVGAILAPDLEAVQRACGGVEPPWEEVERLLGAAVRRQCESLTDYKHPRKVEVRRGPLERTSLQKVRRVAYQGALDE